MRLLELLRPKPSRAPVIPFPVGGIGYEHQLQAMTSIWQDSAIRTLDTLAEMHFPSSPNCCRVRDFDCADDVSHDGVEWWAQRRNDLIDRARSLEKRPGIDADIRELLVRIADQEKTYKLTEITEGTCRPWCELIVAARMQIGWPHGEAWAGYPWRPEGEAPDEIDVFKRSADR
ncbi:MAG: hypothetical protein AAFY88_12995 [Acidobacteriota bacterium]